MPDNEPIDVTDSDALKNDEDDSDNVTMTRANWNLLQEKLGKVDAFIAANPDSIK